jgi:GDP-L-fucose synthase
MNLNSKIYISGHKGMVGSSLLSKLNSLGYLNIIVKNKSDLDLRNQSDVDLFFQKEKPEYVFIIAAKIGGIAANMKYPAEFLYDNLMIQSNLIHCSFKHSVKKIIFLGSSCIYPKESPQPMKEEYLLTGTLEPTNEGYAIAKISGLKLLEFYHKQYGISYLSLMPSNLYGPGDSFDPSHSHVLSATVKKFVDAIIENREEVLMWGSGIARREFLHVNDLVDIMLDILNKKIKIEQFINIGTGVDISIKELAELVASLTGFKGKILWDTSKPNGMLKKCMEVSKMKSLGLKPKIGLEEGIKQMIIDYKNIVSKNNLATENQ